MKISGFWIKTARFHSIFQLKDLIKYYISTAKLRITSNFRSRRLSKELQINFETVRKAYKELEKEGWRS